QTALLCGMTWMPPIVLHDADRADTDAVALHIEHVARHLAAPPLPPGVQDFPETEVTGEGA
ncbi:hypothetical protein MYF60_27265, partial [Klebsiella pneumoniae]|nr:hypothetical protein [Klebsiella pneumoniae]